MPKMTVLALRFALALFTLVLASPATAQSPPPAAAVTPDPWPRTISLGGAKYALYQPQVDSWTGGSLEAHSAVSVLPAGSQVPVFGVIEITAKTEVDRAARSVYFRDIAIAKATFPSAPQSASQYQQGFQQLLASGRSTMSLDRLEAMLAVTGAEKKAKSVPVKNDPPAIVFSQTSAILVPIDGAPIWRPVAGTGLQRVLNTRAFLVWDASAGLMYLHLLDGFVQAPTFTGQWTVAPTVPADVSATAAALAKDGVVDLMTGPRDDKTKTTPTLKSGAPRVVVSTKPTELVITESAPDWVPIENSALVYVKNTTGNVFLNLGDQKTYVLVTGRWFRGEYLSGPWEYVAGSDLPPDFAKIPDDSPKENVKASVPGTPQAQSAVIANEIPQMATVERAKAQFAPVIDGAVVLEPIPDTTLSYVFNSPQPIIMVTPGEWYAVQSGVWFTAPAALGPWVVAATIPAVIYSIPPSSPVHYATYVRVYDVTPQYVVVGYTPGYFGTVVAPGGVVVYGTGYTYVPYVGAAVWYPPPVTYGYAAAVTWTPWTGWAVGFGFGLAFGAAVSWSSHCCWGYCPAPYWGGVHYSYGAAYGWHGAGVAWGPGGWAATSGNVYHQWGATGAVTRTSGGYNAWTGNAWSSQVGHSYNSVTGRISAGQRGAVQNVYTGNYAYGSRGATYNPSTGVSARGGTITTGNAYTGRQNTATAARVTGPGGQSVSAAKVDGNYYATHDGNVYHDTGNGWQHYNNGSWNTVQRPAQVPSSLGSDAQARTVGDTRAAGSSWGSSNWGDGFDRSSSSSGGSWWDRGSGGWDRSDGWGRSGGWDTGSGWDRSSSTSGSSGGGDRSGGGWGGRSGGWGGGHFGGFRR
jgi:hypothetical protein